MSLLNICDGQRCCTIPYAHVASLPQSAESTPSKRKVGRGKLAFLVYSWVRVGVKFTCGMTDLSGGKS